jgi:hypothetical protein
MPPKSVVRLARCDKNTPAWRKQIGRIFRVGYYSRQDGLDCVWLVNEAGEYEQSTDHDFLFRYFDIIQQSDEKNLYGRRKPVLKPIIRAGTGLVRKLSYEG